MLGLISRCELKSDSLIRTAIQINHAPIKTDCPAPEKGSGFLLCDFPESLVLLGCS